MSAQNPQDETTRVPGYQFIRANVNYLQDIPEPGKRWTTEDVPVGVKKKLKLALEHGVVSQGEVADPASGRYYYRTNRKAYRDIQHATEVQDTWPCGHTGFVNHGDGEYSCRYDYCDSRFGRDVAREFVG